jgi:NADPH-dependent curcumin reductase CurA
MVGGTVGEIVASRHPKFAVGDIVLSHGGWQDYAVSNGTGLRKLDPAAAPVSTALGVVGMPGMTATRPPRSSACCRARISARCWSRSRHDRSPG